MDIMAVTQSAEDFFPEQALVHVMQSLGLSLST
jgi:hypothetical protein